MKTAISTQLCFITAMQLMFMEIYLRNVLTPATVPISSFEKKIVMVAKGCNYNSIDSDTSTLLDKEGFLSDDILGHFFLGNLGVS